MKVCRLEESFISHLGTLSCMQNANMMNEYLKTHSYQILQYILDNSCKKKTLKSIELHKFFCINVTSNALDVVHFCRFTVRKCCKMSWAKNCI